MDDVPEGKYVLELDRLNGSLVALAIVIVIANHTTVATMAVEEG